MNNENRHDDEIDKLIDKKSNELNDLTLKNNFRLFIVWQPVVGLLISVFFTLFLLFEDLEWSVEVFLFSICPFLFYIVIYILMYIFSKKFYDSLFFFTGRVKYIFICLIITIISLHVVMYNINNFQIRNISLSEIKSMDKLSMGGNSKHYFIVFGADNCTYCHQMENIYINVFQKTKQDLFFCDLSQEAVFDEYLVEHDINSIPLLICYKNGKEVGRLGGLQVESKVNEFSKSVY